MSNPLTLAAALLSAAQAAVRADDKLTLKMREVLSLLVSCGFVLKVDSKIIGFEAVISEFAKSTNPQIMEIFSMLQEQLRLKREGNDGSPKASEDKKRLGAAAVLAKLDSQWRSLCRYEIGKLRDAQSKDDKDEAKKRLSETQAAAEAVAVLIAADPSTLTPDEVKAQGCMKEMFSIMEKLPDAMVLALRQKTFDIMKARKIAAEAAAQAEPTQDSGVKLEKTGTEN